MSDAGSTANPTSYAFGASTREQPTPCSTAEREVDDELRAILARAERLGFAPARVATALGLPQARRP